MLNSYRSGICALAVATSFIAGAAQAESHVVLIMEGGYFPAVTYVSAGDEVIFRNESGATHEMGGPEDVWSSGPIGMDGTYHLSLSEETPLVFTGVSGGIEMQGEVSYDTPPLSE
ncbi:hypothetical protein Z946_788 [Sulfitobacter noctilucicola]|uniref:Plastocyanin n=1 Tax=Sulfitobacter noctilucicola TaxID=1342301 RepID=A0A7W6M6Y8_9RHOB|nr:hypothetical protein [Sulfitobacter noctilucicola]KIN61932.1 hypothetical protein Z946_788 [Sulfitobacter noctilucicola]MBB4173546.1 plastocyanin [Sulfitobacter noctilucicola]